MKNPEQRCSARVPDGGRSVSPHQCLRAGKVQRGGKWYCRVHDPEAVKAKRAARDRAWNERVRAEDAIQAEAKRLARRLGVRGEANFNALPGFGHYERALVIRFEDVETLIARLRP